MDGIHMCAVAMEDAQQRLENATVQLANAETDGFGQHIAGAARRPAREALRATGQPFDLVVTGGGDLTVAAPLGRNDAHRSRLQSASFSRDAAGYLVDARGRALVGTSGPIRVTADAQFRSDGSIVCSGVVVAHIPLSHGAQLHSGFALGSTVNAIGEMVEILDAQRSFETAQKTLAAVDAARQKATTDVGKVQ